MRKPQDLTGKRFGKLIAIERLGPRTYRGSHYWLCECDCGNKHEVQVGHLNAGTVSMCFDCSHNKGDTLQSEYYKCGYDATKRGYSFDITKEYFRDIRLEPCYYCGADGPNGIDRHNNNEGYTEQNTVACCTMCNRMKLNYGVEEFYNQIERIYRYRIERKDNTSTE